MDAEGKLITAGKSDEVSPKPLLHGTHPDPEPDPGLLLQRWAWQCPPSLSPVHGWGSLGVTMLQKEAVFVAYIFYVGASGEYDTQETDHIMSVLYYLGCYIM